MATKTVNARNYTKADFDRRLRYLSDSQELAKLLNELSEPYPYYVFRAKQPQVQHRTAIPSAGVA